MIELVIELVIDPLHHLPATRYPEIDAQEGPATAFCFAPGVRTADHPRERPWAVTS